MKKTYITPALHIERIQAEGFLCASTLNANGGDNVDITVDTDTEHKGSFNAESRIWGEAEWTE